MLRRLPIATPPEPAGDGGAIERRFGLSRRTFLQFCAGLAASMGLSNAAAETVAATFDTQLPERGEGAEQALRELLGGLEGTLRTSGPRWFHFITGGTTPAALGADWLTTVLDQNPGAWIASGSVARIAIQLKAITAPGDIRRRSRNAAVTSIAISMALTAGTAEPEISV